MSGSSSSVIEIVSSLDSKENKNSSSSSGVGVVIFDVFGACAYGDLSKLRKYVEEDGVSVSQPDGNGYYPLQWASLNNFPHLVYYIIQVCTLNLFVCLFVWLLMDLVLIIYILSNT